MMMIMIMAMIMSMLMLQSLRRINASSTTTTRIIKSPDLNVLYIFEVFLGELL